MCYNAYPTRTLNVCYTIPQCLLNVGSLCRTSPIYKGPLTRSGHCKRATAARRPRRDNRVCKVFHWHTPQKQLKKLNKSLRGLLLKGATLAASTVLLNDMHAACSAQKASSSTKNSGIPVKRSARWTVFAKGEKTFFLKRERWGLWQKQTSWVVWVSWCTLTSVCLLSQFFVCYVSDEYSRNSTMAQGRRGMLPQALAEATRERCHIGRVAHMLLSWLQLLNLYYYSRMLPEQPFKLPNVQTKFTTMPGEGLLNIRPFKMFQPAQKCSCWDRYCQQCAHGTCMLTSWLLTILNTTLHTISSACCFERLC